MNLLNKVHIHNITYVVLLISFFAGYFEYVFLLLLFIIIHEFGHILCASIFKYEIDEIIIFPFGGISKFNILLNSSINKELLISIGGPLIQILFYYLMCLLNFKGLINEITFKKIYLINFSLLSFNLLPVVPLDGSKILELILEKYIPYRKANIIKISVSLIFAFLIIILNHKVFVIVLILLIFKNSYYEFINLREKYNKFLIEKYIYNFDFKKYKLIKSINEFYRNKNHFINDNNKYICEKTYLKKKFDLNHTL